MFSSSANGANAYTKIGVETGVIAASPHKLIVMLFEGAIVAINNAQVQMQSGDIAAKGKSISKAISIIDNGLRASLDKRVGGEIALNLDALYEYMTRQLLLANLNNSEDALIEVSKLLRDLKSAWDAIAPQATTAETAPVMMHDPLQPRPTHVFEA
ncbi:flagellar export chaperone FliS [Undibacterium rugosum]|uniref:Flagellar secretion chaperone FliS n=1 Tax=Undibacterium rugosum TaxID=2762291 RepID=A0A923KZD8_9BURK|nr:flagellar export chaperone FliS [Undibacterium rugosum]MBC3934911.1 flagellar export chaperone FliS [Undibacterium rugosum]MBR7778228.1 flagellar export chaperone FliS [Undibacterium rugosum]